MHASQTAVSRMPDETARVDIAVIDGPGGTNHIMPRTIDQCARYAKAAALAGVISAEKIKDRGQYRWQNAAEVIASGTMKIMQGMEVGLPPMQALQLIAMINGKMCVHSEGVPALLWSKGFRVNNRIEGAGDERTAICTVTRPDGTETTRPFAVADAKTAGLWAPSHADSPWNKYPERMLMARALGFAARDGASDAMRGIWIAEEARDIPVRELASQSQPAQRRTPVPKRSTRSAPPPIIPEGGTVVMDGVDYLRVLQHAMDGCTDEADVAKVWAAHESGAPPMSDAEHSTARLAATHARARIQENDLAKTTVDEPGARTPDDDQCERGGVRRSADAEGNARHVERISDAGLCATDIPQRQEVHPLASRSA